MPTLTIDNQQITVPEGMNVLEAAKRLGIVIPHFCYHEALGAVGACRQCAMTFLDGPVKGLQMSCMVKAQDGMVVSTLEARAAELRKHVAEWLMTNHPHDCPVCDEGGECLLQDMTVASGHGIRRYGGRKKTYNNQYLGPFLWHEMNRCIQCYRCVRTYRDYCGGTDFGVLGCNQRIYFGRFKDGTLQSPFSGNLADVCPTGVFTDKTFRYRARYWDLQEAPSVCPHCSLGCAVIPGARYRELQRVRAGVNRETNGFFICDRARFGYGHANHPQRPRRPRLGEREVSWGEALGETRLRLTEFASASGMQAVAFVGSSRASLEANAGLLALARSLGCDRVALTPHPGRDRAARMTAALLGEQASSLEQIRESDFVLVVGADPLNEGPGLALAVRQAVRKGATAALLDPRPVELPFSAIHLPLSPERLAYAVRAIASDKWQDGFSRQEAAVLAGISSRLREARRPVLACGADLLGEEGVAVLLETARSLSSADRPCGAAILLGGPNSFGCALLAQDGPDFDTILEGIEKGEIRALVCLESDPFSEHPDPPRIRQALARLDLLIAADYLPTETAQRADILLPTTVPSESAGIYVNNEGRMLPFASAFEPGIPIGITGDGGHPPRTFEAVTPGSEPRPAWAVMQFLRGLPAVSPALLRRQLETADSRFAGLSALHPEGTGERVSGGIPTPAIRPSAGSGAGLRLLAAENLFGSEPISAFSPLLVDVRPSPRVWLHVDDAERLGLEAGDSVRLATEIGEATAVLELSAAMSPGLVVVPRLRGTPLEIFVPGAGLRPCRLTKEGAP